VENNQDFTIMMAFNGFLLTSRRDNGPKTPDTFETEVFMDEKDLFSALSDHFENKRLQHE